MNIPNDRNQFIFLQTVQALINLKQNKINVANASKIRRTLEQTIHFFMSPIKLTKRISVNLQFLNNSGYLEQISGKNFTIPEDFIKKGVSILEDFGQNP